MSDDVETSATPKTAEEIDSQLPNPTENPPTASASASSAGHGADTSSLSTGSIAVGPMLNPYLPPGVVPYYRQVATGSGSGSVALPSNSTTTAVGTTPPTSAAFHPHHHQHGVPAFPTMHMFPPHYNPYSFMQNQHTYQQQYHAAAMAFNPHAPPYGPSGGIQVGMISPYGIGYPYGMVDPLRRQSFPPVPTTTVPSTTPAAVEKKKQAETEDSSSSQPKTIPGLASLTSPSYYPSPPDINESRRTGTGRKIVPVTRDVPEDLAEQRPDELYEEVDVLDSTASASDATTMDQANIADPGSYPWATSVSGPSTFHGVPLTTKFRCKICDHIFPKKHTVVTHIKTHLGKKSYPCTHPGCNMAFVREHDRKRHQTTHTGEKAHTCECGKQFSRQDALRRHAQYGRCPNRGPVPSQLANVKAGVPASISDDEGDVQDPDEEAIAKALDEDATMDVVHEGDTSVADNGDEDQLVGDDGATASTSNPPGRTRGRRSTAPKKEKAETAAPKPRTSRKKRKRAAFARPVDDGDSELDEDSDGAAPSPPPPTIKRKPKKQRKSPQAKPPPPAPATDPPEEEDELIDSYEEEDPNHAPSSFQFALPGVHSKEQIKEVQPKTRVQPRRGRADGTGSMAAASVDETAVAGTQTEQNFDATSLQPRSFASTAEDSNSGDKYATIMERMNRTPFNIETEVMKTSFPLGLVRNVGGQGVASEALVQQQADQDVTMSDWVQDQDSDVDADASEGIAGVGSDETKLADVPPAPGAAIPLKSAIGDSSGVDSDDPEEEDVAAVLGVARASKETPSAVAA